jgi:hypothetical protein
VFFSTPALRAGGPLGHQLHAERRQHLQDCPERWIHVAAKRSVKTCAVDVCLFGNGPHSVGSREVADRSGGKSRIIGRERVIQVLRNNFGLLRNLMASKALALDIGQPPSLFSPSRSILDDLRHSSRFSFRRPQCFSFRGGSNTRSTRRLNALSMPIRAIMVGLAAKRAGAINDTQSQYIWKQFNIDNIKTREPPNSISRRRSPVRSTTWSRSTSRHGLLARRPVEGADHERNRIGEDVLDRPARSRKGVVRRTCASSRDRSVIKGPASFDLSILWPKKCSDQSTWAVR